MAALPLRRPRPRETSTSTLTSTRPAVALCSVLRGGNDFLLAHVSPPSPADLG